MASSGFEDVRRAPVEGTTLAYRELGQGEPVVFVHGALSDLRTWAALAGEVGRGFRAISYSRRFARPNDDIAPGANDPWQRHAEDLAAFLRQVDAAPAHLVGNSQGAFISLLTAVRHPEVVRTLVLEEPPVFPLFLPRLPPRPAELLRLFVTRPRTALAILGFGARTIGPVQKALRENRDDEAMRIFGLGVLGKEFLERVPDARREQMRDNLSTLRAGLLGEGFPPIGDDDVRGVRAPVLLVTGEHSPRVLVRLTDRLEELLPNVERVEIRGASHLMHEDDPKAVHDAIVAFLARARGRAAALADGGARSR